MISLEEVKKLAMLARIEMDKKELEELQKDLGHILDYVGQFKKAPPAGEAGPAKEIETSEKISNVFREDEPIIDESEIKKGEHIKVKHIF